MQCTVQCRPMASGARPKVPVRDFKVLEDDEKELKYRPMISGARQKVHSRNWRDQPAVKREFEVLKDDSHKRSSRFGLKPGFDHGRQVNYSYSRKHTYPGNSLGDDVTYSRDLSKSDWQKPHDNREPGYDLNFASPSSLHDASVRKGLCGKEREGRYPETKAKERVGNNFSVIDRSKGVDGRWRSRSENSMNREKPTRQLDTRRLKEISSLETTDIVTELGEEGSGCEELLNHLLRDDVTYSGDFRKPGRRKSHYHQESGYDSNFTQPSRLHDASVRKGLRGKERADRYPETKTKERVENNFSVIDRCKGVDERGRSRSRNSMKPTRQLDIKRLKEISSLEPKDIIIQLGGEDSGCEELLNQQEMPREVQLLLLKTLSRACQCSSSSMLLHSLLRMVWNSTYLTKHLLLLVTTFLTTLGNEMDNLSKTICSDVIVLLHALLQLSRNSSSEVGVLIPLLENALKLKEDKGSYEDISKRLQDLKDLYQTLALDEKDRVNQATLKAHYKPPPNDFRRMPILPTSKELRKDQQPFLRQNLTTGKYVDIHHYLDVQFRLLREDFVAPLRGGISEYLENQNSDKYKHRRIEEMRLYSRVHILNPMVGRNGIVHTLQFDIRPLSRVQWESSKRLLPGSLVCLTKNDFQTVIFAIVETRNTQELQHGRLVVQFNNFEDIIGTESGESFLMAETTAYFEQYRPVLLGLQEMGKQDRYGNNPTIPMEQYIVHASRVIHCPSYLSDKDNTFYDLRHLTWKQDCKDVHENLEYDKSIKMNRIKRSKARWVPLFETGLWPPAETLDFDESQLAAFQAALSREFALIQGPPGTGKTYVGLKVVQTLLFNRHVWSTMVRNRDTTPGFKPILIVCYTNHALDQFLEGIHAFEKDIIRIGGGSKSEILKSRNLSEIRYQRRKSRHCPRTVNPDYERLKRLLENAQDRLELAHQSVIREQSLLPYMDANHVRSFKAFTSGQQTLSQEGITMLFWLGLIDDQWIQEKQENNGTNNTRERQEQVLQQIQVQEDESTIEVLGEAELIAQIRQMEEEDPIMKANRRERKKVLLKESAFVIGLGSPHDNWTSDDTNRIGEVVTHELGKLHVVCSDQHAYGKVDVWSVPPKQRWRLYRYWLAKYVEEQENLMLHYQEIYQGLSHKQKEVDTEEDENILKEAKVIGMTTTGAAKHRALLQRIKPRIIVIEEAAEVLEAHIITTLTNDCQHLILIGDHQQLRPNPTVYRLAKQFKLDVSMFERMINNRIPCQQLNLQHRMRPEISILMKRHFYKQLDDHQSVLKYDNVLGIGHNIFFIQHNEVENVVDDIKSKSNVHEAAFLVQLCRYFLKQGYSPSQITILTTYTGQLLNLKRQMEKSTFEGVRVCVVDNYQGEENDIILLSLVRSNDEGNVGFLKVDNRVCVALSRARKGLFCIGNLALLAERSSLWRDIMETLSEKQVTGRVLPLVCLNHSETTEVACADDFRNVPDGGCSKTCEFRLSCGHVCEKSCHPLDPDHSGYACQKPCARKCTRSHPCQLECAERCKCVVEVTITMPECGHEQKMPCWKCETWTCKTPCIKSLECGHPCTNRCGEPCLPSALCKRPCERKCTRDHACKLRCGEVCKCKESVEKTMPLCQHIQTLPCHEFETWTCKMPCTKNLECGHTCTRLCGEPCLPSLMCKQPCERMCSRDHACKLLCGNVCKCKENVDKTMPLCQHMQTLPCHEFETWRCRAPCEQKLECCHTCPRKCGEACPSRYLCQEQCTKKCVRDHLCKLKCNDDCRCEDIVTKTMPLCGHEQKMPCFEYDSWVCRESCEKTLDCGHQCRRVCGRSCEYSQCKEPCEKKLFCGHTCRKMCYQKCEETYEICKPTCMEVVEITLPGCLHKRKIYCKNNPEFETRLDQLPISRRVTILEICERLGKTHHYPQCVEKCQRRLSCGHECQNKCKDPCNKCEILLDKELDCGHMKSMKCCADPHYAKCDKTCSKMLPCGHPCKNRCVEPCQTRCYEKVLTKLPNCEHEKQIDCATDKKDVVCKNKCSKKLPCGHTCQKKCHEPCSVECKIKALKVLECGHEQHAACCIQKKDLNCTKKCPKTLLCGHSCQGLCSQPCSSLCEVMKKKTMPECHHLMFVKCCEDVHNVTCRGPCEKKLPCGHECRKRCGDPCDNKCQMNKKIRMKGCKHQQTMPCYVDINDHICQAHCKKQLKCGHRCAKRCGEPCKCGITKKKKIPGCGHMQLVECQVKLCDHVCQENCRKKLPCRHTCSNKCGEHCVSQCEQTIEKILRRCKHKHTMPCYMHPKDFKCTDRCKRQLKCGHQCQQACGEPCVAPCQVSVTKKLPKCKHRMKMTCSEDTTTKICPFECRRKLKCGHFCKNKCAEPCVENCQVAVPKNIDGCQHSNIVPCSQDVTSVVCKNQCSKYLACGHKCITACGEQCQCDIECEKNLPCGHGCKKRCGEPCTRVCVVPVQKTIDECGHLMSKAIPCHMTPTRADCDSVCGLLTCGHECTRPCNACIVHGTGRKLSEEQTPCTAKCDVLLHCGHRCTNSCDKCYGGRVHKQCQSQCKRTLLCGCKCERSCTETCNCDNKLKATCALQRCARRVGHYTRMQQYGKVRKSCIHPGLGPCNKPCKKKIGCGHRCIGLCGETCIDLCRYCDREKVLAIFPEYEVSKDPCYIKLIPCGHIAEVESLTGDYRHKTCSVVTPFTPLCCPKCQEKVYNDRFSDMLTIWETDIKEIHSLVSRRGLEHFRKEESIMLPNVEIMRQNMDRENVYHVKSAGVWLHEMKKAQCSLQKRFEKLTHIADLHGIGHKSEQMMERTCTVIKNAIADATKTTSVLSSQMAQDLTCELNRLHYWCEVLEALSSAEISDESGHLISESISRAIGLISTPCKFTEERYEDVQKNLDDFHREVGLDDGLTTRNHPITLPTDKLNPPGFSLGEWLKCRKGHYFTMLECQAYQGASIEDPKCPICNAEDKSDRGNFYRN